MVKGASKMSEGGWKKEERMRLKDCLLQYTPPTTEPSTPIILEPNKWQDVRIFLSSSFIETHGERDILVKHVIPSVNRQLASKLIRIIAVDLRWGVLGKESKDCETIQKTCLNLVEACKDHPNETPWLIALRTDRYGWVQTHYQSSDGFNNPENFTWLDDLRQSVSITSLECLHATLSSSSRNIKPKVFVYERRILNPENIEPHLKWVFDFEYLEEQQKVKDEVKLQYTKTPHASTYKRDQEDLNDFLRSCDGVTVTYRQYSCSYVQGNAKTTGARSDGKKFGIGRVSELEGFAQQVEQDLLESITANFKTADLKNIPAYKLQNIPFENAMHEKATHFVGRQELLRKCFHFCVNGDIAGSNSETKVERDNDDNDSGRNVPSSNILIVHGQPGSGKSGLVAALSKKCIEELREKGNFVFVHSVDTCTNSTDLPSMLRRLHLNLKLFTGGSDYESHTISDLKKNHINYLEKRAGEHPDKLFLVIVDAVNQFTSNFRAYSIWWARLLTPPPNLRIVISTLEKENSTFDNACKVYPKALKVHMPDMSMEDATKVVKTILDKYRKKLTEDQIAALLRKNKYPLFVTAATHALRTFGIYEQLSNYIEKLPCDVPELFDFLLNEWIGEYGKYFIRDVCSIVHLSRDGILENTLNEVLSFIEKEEGIDYNCSFSRLFDALREFLAAGGAGEMRFFHDQVNKVVKKKFLSSPSAEYRMNVLLFHYYLEKISPQLCEKPRTSTPVHYGDFLSEVIHHEINTMTGETNTNEYFLNTLRNVYYIRERVNMGQQDALLQDYNRAVLGCTNSDTVKALRSWNKFAISYTPYILKYGRSLSLYNIVKQQPPTSRVFMDMTVEGEVNDGYHLIWSNPPVKETDDDIVLTYGAGNKPLNSSCVEIVGGVRLLCVGGSHGLVSLYEADTGVLLHEMKVGRKHVRSVHISPTSRTYWCGDNEGFVSVLTTDTGDLLWRESVGEGYVYWLCGVDEKILCGTRKGNISVLSDSIEYNKLHSWNTEEKDTTCYSYLRGKDVVLSGHYEGVVKVWSMSGELMKKLVVKVWSMSDEVMKKLVVGEDIVWCLAPYPTDDDVVAIGYDNKVTVFNVTTEKELFTIPHVWGRVVKYNNNGDRMFTIAKGYKTVLVLDSEGKLLNKLHGPKNKIEDICSVPGTCDLVTVGWNGECMLLEVSTPPDVEVETEVDTGDEVSVDGDVLSCGILAGGEEFFTTTDEYFLLQIWNTQTLQCVRSVEVKGIFAVAHPTRQVVITYGDYYEKKLLLVDITHLTTISEVELESQTEDKVIREVKMSPLGDKCVVVCVDGTCQVVSINETFFSHICNVKLLDEIHSCDIHNDGVHVVSGGGCGVHLWNINSGETIRKLAEVEAVWDVRFIHDDVLYKENKVALHLMSLDGIHIRTFNNFQHSLFVYHQHYMITRQWLTQRQQQQQQQRQDNGLSVWDINTGELLYVFADHRTKRFEHFLEFPSYVLGFNKDHKMYKFNSINSKP